MTARHSRRHSDPAFSTRRKGAAALWALPLLLFPLPCSVFHLRPQADVPATVRFLFLDESGAHYTAQVGESRQTISSYPYAVGDPVEASAGETVTVFREPADAGKRKKPKPIEVAHIEISADTGELLAVLRPTRNGRLHETTFYPDDLNAFPVGSAQVVNLGQSDFRVQMGETETTLAPGEAETLYPTPDRKYRVVTRVLERKADGEWKKHYDGITTLRPGQRLRGLIIYSPSGMKHTYTRMELAEYGDPPPGHRWITHTDRPEVENEGEGE